MNKAIQPIIILLGAVAYLAFGDKMFNNEEEPVEETEISEEVDAEEEEEESPEVVREVEQEEEEAEEEEEEEQTVVAGDYPIFDNCKPVEQYTLKDSFKKLQNAPTLYKTNDNWMIYGDYYLDEICYAANKNIYLMVGSRSISLGDTRLKVFQFNANTGDLRESNEFMYAWGDVEFGARNGGKVPLTITSNFPDYTTGENEIRVTKLIYDLKNLTLIEQ